MFPYEKTIFYIFSFKLLLFKYFYSFKVTVFFLIIHNFIFVLCRLNFILNVFNVDSSTYIDNVSCFFFVYFNYVFFPVYVLCTLI